VTGWETITVVSANSTSSKTTTATCSSGKKVFGGGYVIAASGNETQVTVTGAYPSANNAWTVTTVKNQGSPGWTVSVYALCANA
jgi:hypothetical protein